MPKRKSKSPYARAQRTRALPVQVEQPAVQEQVPPPVVQEQVAPAPPVVERKILPRLKLGLESCGASSVDFEKDGEDNSINIGQPQDSKCHLFQSSFMSNFKIIQILGKGGFGVVYEAKHKLDKCNYAVKRIALDSDSEKKVMREVEALTEFDHGNIVRYHTSWIEKPPTGWQENRDREILTELSESAQLYSTTNEDASSRKRSSSPRPIRYLYIKMQLCQGGDLKDWLISNTLKRDHHTMLEIFYQLVCAIEYVHARRFMHRDLKPSNIFFSPFPVVKIGDFGLVKALQEEQNPYKKHTPDVGTISYRSPEQNKNVYSEKVDIFSLGLILFELLYPFDTEMERSKTLKDVKEQKFPEKFTREMTKECKLISLLLFKDPDERPTAEKVLKSDLLKKFKVKGCQTGLKREQELMEDCV